jgi:hypothetical protein
MQKNKLLLIIIAFAFTSTLEAQSETLGWSSLAWKSTWKFPVDVELSGNYRTKNEWAERDSYFSEVELSYDLTKSLTTEVEWRRVNNRDTNGNIQGIETWNRLRVNLKYEYTPIPGTLGLRVGYQRRFALSETASMGESYRLLLSYELAIKNWKADPELFSEYRWNQVADSNNELRYGISVARKFDAIKVGLRFFLERTVNVPKIDNNLTAVIDLSLQIAI